MAIDASSAWSKLLEECSTLPADSDAWDNVDGFVDELQSLAVIKLEEREAGRNQLSQSLGRLLGSFKDDLEFFDMSSAAGWAADGIARQEAVEVAALVDAVCGELQSRRDLEATHGDHYAAEKQRRASLSELEDKIAAQLSAIEVRFGSEPAAVALAEPLPAAATPLPPEPAEPVVVIDLPEVAESAVSQPDAPDGDSDSWTHSALDEAGKRYSPLTVAQENQLLGESSGVCLVIASGALDFEVIPKAIQRFAQGHAVSPIPFEVKDADETWTWLERYAEANKSAKSLIVHQTIAVPTPALDERVDAALRFCRGYSTSGAGRLRVAFLLAPGAAWGWLAQPENRRREMEAQIDSIICPTPWNAQAVCQRMHLHNLPASGDGCHAIVEETGGFPWLIDKLFDNISPLTGMDGAIEQLHSTLTPGGPLSKELPARLGLMAAPPARDFLQLIRELGETHEEKFAMEAVARGIDGRQCKAVIDLLECIAAVSREDGVVRLNPFVRRLLMKS